MITWIKNIFKEFFEYEKEMREAGLYILYADANWVIWLDPELMETHEKEDR